MHGPVGAMGVSREELPQWDGIQFVTAQLARLPKLDDEAVGTDVCIGPNADKPLWLDIPLFVSDMSFGALSPEAKTALARGAELAGTGICSGEGGMLPEEQAENSRYFYELASARFGWSFDVLKKVQAFHFKGGQGAKTGHRRAPARHTRWSGASPRCAACPRARPRCRRPRSRTGTRSTTSAASPTMVREESGGIPIGFKLSAQHIEEDLDAALSVGVDYVILDGRGGGTGAAPLVFRDHISVPTMPALARARAHLDRRGRRDVTLVITGGLRHAPDFAKALALGADAVAVANSAIQAIGCLGMRACTVEQLPGRDRHPTAAPPSTTARRRSGAPPRPVPPSNRAPHAGAGAARCGHEHLNQFSVDDLTTFDRDIAHLTGVAYGGSPSRMSWSKVAELDDLPEGRVRTVIAGRRSLVLTHVGDEYGALDNKCPHQGGPLGEGSIEKGWLRCPWHGYDYDPLTGTPAAGLHRRADALPGRGAGRRRLRRRARRRRARAHGVRRDGRDDGGVGRDPRVRDGRAFQPRLRRRHAPPGGGAAT